MLKNPNDSIDLVLLLESYGETIGTMYPQAIVYDPNNSEITGSPFDLTLLANNMYVKSGAFQASLVGDYKVIYIVYTDAAHTVRSSSHSEKSDIITIAIQSTTGLGGGTGDIYVNLDPLKKQIERLKEDLEDKIGKIQKEIDDGFKIDIPQLKSIPKDIKGLESLIKGLPTPKDYSGNFSDIIKPLNEIKNIGALLQQSQKNNAVKLIDAIKKNRSTIIKSKFDKSLLSPLIESIVNSNIKSESLYKQTKMDMVNLFDGQSKKIKTEVNNSLENQQKNFIKLINELNEQVRVKLKFTFEKLAKLFLSIRKQTFNINLKKDE